MSNIMNNFGLVGALGVVDKRELIAELKAEIKKDMEQKRISKTFAKIAKQEAREQKRADRIAALEAKLEALRNPVGSKAIKANRKAGKVTITKFA